MFKLLRLAIYALVGYAAYQFVMDLVHATQEPQKPQRRGQGQGQGQGQARGNRSGAANRSRSGGSGNGGTRATGGARMTATARAGGQGKQEETQNPDGGSVRHRVGRGVV